MPQKYRAVLVTVLLVLVVFVIGALAFIYSGVYNIAATDPHNPVVRWALNTTQEQSIRAHTDEAPEPIPVDSAMLAHGFRHYHEMCVVCHGAPGVERGEYGKGLNPEPPDLSRAATRWSTRETFWIVRHGIKMAGMPAFGPTHTDEEIWGIAAAVNQLPELSAEEYRRIVEAVGAGTGPGHGHGGGTAEQRGAAPGEADGGHSHPPGTSSHPH